MGSGKRKYKRRHKKFSLGGFKSENDAEPKDPERVKELIDLWKKSST